MQLEQADTRLIQKFWQTICEMDRNVNPAINNKGEKDRPFNERIRRNNGDDGIFYLGITRDSKKDSPVERTVDVELGKKLFFTSLGIIATEFESNEDLVELARNDQGSIVSQSIEIDGGQTLKLTEQEITKDFRVREPVKFMVNFPPDVQKAIFPAKVGANHENAEAVADGAYLISDPLQEFHEIHFRGEIICSHKLCLEKEFFQDVRYKINMKA